jgi:putative ABC transport system permease protein
MRGEPNRAGPRIHLHMGPSLQDLRYALRILIRNPAFTTVTVLSLALGIGANTTIFSFVNALLLKPPAVGDPDRLVEVWEHNTTRGTGIGSSMQLSYPDFEYFRDHNRSFSAMAAFTGEPAAVVWNREGEGEMLRAAMVSDNFFSLLGVRPALGRAFLAQEDRSGTDETVVVLSHALWKDRFGSDPAVLGQGLVLNGRRFTVIGVAPPSFTGLMAGFTADVWTPMPMHAAVNPGIDLAERHQHWVVGVGQLRPGMTQSDAAADLALLGQQLATTYPDANRHLAPSAMAVALIPSPFRGVVGGASGVLMAVVGLVLLIACANVANLLLAKAAGRRREIAIRFALGANRRRVVQQVLTESVVIAVIAGALGLVFSMWAAPLLLSMKPASLPLFLNVSPDVRVLGFTLAASLMTGVAFGLAPALQQSRIDQIDGLKEGSQQSGASKSRLRSALVVAQVTACVVLLVGASLCLRSLMNARSIDPGFTIENGVTASLNVQTFGYDETRGREFYDNLLARVRTVPGVRAAALADHLPLGQIMRMAGVVVPGAGTEPIGIELAIVTPGYFEAMGIPLVRGRDFTANDDPRGPAVVVINEQMAKRYWPQQNAVGEFITLAGRDNQGTRAQVIGVVRTGKYQSLGESPKPYLYRPLAQEYGPNAQLIVRAVDETTVGGSLRETVRSLDPRLALVGLETLRQHMQLPLFPAQAAGALLGLFGALALLLAVVGLYGVISYTVSQRAREIGVRIALGARDADVVRLVLSQGLRLTALGLGIGFAGALAVSRVLSSVLYGVTPTDPVSFGLVGGVLMIVALVASYVPARWAMRVDPIRALRSE